MNSRVPGFQGSKVPRFGSYGSKGLVRDGSNGFRARCGFIRAATALRDRDHRPQHGGARCAPISRVTDDGGYVAANVTLKALIEAAYRQSGFDRREVAGGPAWIATDRFDVVAKSFAAPVIDADGFPRQSLRMLQELLKERFQLRIRARNEQRSVYALVATGVNGPRLTPTSIDCAAAPQGLMKGARGMNICGVAAYPGRLTANGITVTDLAGLLTPFVDRTVIDRTRLSGRFDIDVEGVEFNPKGPFGPSYRPSDTKESVFKLIQPQLGLRLLPETAVVEVLFIESATRPGEQP
jgi:uncharacterized protein (TIGR03435 family)